MLPDARFSKIGVGEYLDNARLASVCSVKLGLDTTSPVTIHPLLRDRPQQVQSLNLVWSPPEHVRCMGDDDGFLYLCTLRTLLVSLSLPEGFFSEFFRSQRQLKTLEMTVSDRHYFDDDSTFTFLQVHIL
jgi:hypothetical protein